MLQQSQQTQEKYTNKSYRLLLFLNIVAAVFWVLSFPVLTYLFVSIFRRIKKRLDKSFVEINFCSNFKYFIRIYLLFFVLSFFYVNYTYELLDKNKGVVPYINSGWFHVFEEYKYMTPRKDHNRFYLFLTFDDVVNNIINTDGFIKNKIFGFFVESIGTPYYVYRRFFSGTKIYDKILTNEEKSFKNKKINSNLKK